MSPKISGKHFQREISFMRREKRPLLYVRNVENSHVLKMKWFLLFRGGRGREYERAILYVSV